MDESNQQPVRLAELMQLVSACREGIASEEQFQQLCTTLETSLDARQAFVELMHLENTLSYRLRSLSPSRSGTLCTSDSRPLTDSANHSGRNVAWSTVLPLAKRDKQLNTREWSIYRVALPVILALCLILAGWLLGRYSHDGQPDQVADTSGNSAEQEHPERQTSLPLAAEIVAYSPGSRWGLMNLAVMPGGTSLRPGQPVQLQGGTAKIRFANGGVVVLQGPAVLEVESGEAGYLRSGKATLITSHGGGPVRLTTPSSRAVVRNAEMGVLVNEADGSAEVSVLAGNVEVSLLNKVGLETKRETIPEGFAGRFEASRLEMLHIEFNEQTFIQEMPEAYIAYHNRLGFSGDQVFEGALGMDFVVKDPIEITKLGVFDSDADGLRRTITAELWSRNEAGTAYRFDDDFGEGMLARQVFTKEKPGELIESNRFKPLERPLRLKSGAYTIVAYGYGEEEPNGNEGDQIRLTPEERDQEQYRMSLASKALDDGRGAILFVGSSRFDVQVGIFPSIVDPGSSNRYRAGTFEFRRATPKKDAGAPRNSLIYSPNIQKRGKRRTSRVRYVPSVQLVLLASVVATMLGCNRNSRPDTIPISGSVTYGGEEWPVAGQIHFLPLEPAEGYPRRPATAPFAKDGKFPSPTSWEEGDGIVPGKYRVYVECWKIKPTTDGPSPVSYVADKYISGASSDIEVEITVDSRGGAFHWDIDPRSG